MEINRRDFIKAATAALVQMGLLQKGLAAQTTSSKSVVPSSSEMADLITTFEKPPRADQPGGYWWWFNTLMNKEGITRDLEEFSEKGLGEVLLVNSAANENNLPMPSGPPFLGEEWFELYKFALSEANRLGITVGFNLCAGWCMGGPWIKPEESGRWYLQSRKPVTGPMKFSEKLPLPDNTAGYKDVRNPPGIKEYFDLPLEKLDYRDTAIVAVPLSKAGNAEIAGKRAEFLAAKANRMDASNWTPAVTIMEKPLEPWANAADDAPISAGAVVDLTDKLQPDGQLVWDVPEGDWIIVRTGHRMTGSKTFLGLPGAEGLSVDWLNRHGVEKQFKSMGEPLLTASKPYIGNTLAYFCDDSFEDGFPNWTDNIIDQFKKYRGYDPTPYLPALCGFIIESAEVTDRFLNDYRKTVADCMADEHYGRFAELCHDAGIKVQNESAGPSRSGTMCMDGLKNLGRSDYPMGEFWLGKRYGEPDEENWELGYGKTRLEDGQNKVTKMVASAAHLYGKKLVSTESFTSTGRTHWLNHPHLIKYAADRAFCEGVNRMMIHTVTGTRPEDGKPGYEYYAGTHFNPNVTWWDQAGGFLAYLARCQNLLRQGLFVADVLYYNGDWAPNLVEAKHTDPSLGKGYDYDTCNEEILLTRLSVKDSRIMLPDGMSYNIFVLPETDEMPVAVLQKVAALVKAGATVIGPKPVKDPGLKNYPACDQQVKDLADEVWGDCDGKSVTSHSYGQGNIYWGVSQRDVLAKLNVPPDFSVSDESAYMDFIHRKTDAADIYYVLNRKRDRQSSACRFRVANRQPYLLDPITGQSRALPEFETGGQHTEIPLEFLPREAYFIVFPRADEAVKADGKNFLRYKPVQTINGKWTVEFDPEWGGPASVEFTELSDWSKHENDGIRHYSGSAVYKKTFDLPADLAESQHLVLDLGEVKNIADVRLNGKDLGTVWTDPWQADISGIAKPGENKLELKVTNLWPNRLIGDAALPKDQRLTNTNIEFKPDAPLLPSGLLGPVTVQVGS